jgi:hypothetical protein
MAARMTKPASRHQLNAGLVEAAIRRHVDHRRNILIPEASIRFGVGSARGEYRADYIMVSQASYATELEVKVSVADWRRDLAKPKLVGMPDWITRFVYVVPEALGLPEWVPAWAGIWHVVPALVGHYDFHQTRPRADGYAIVVKRPPCVRGREKLPNAVLGTWYRNLYYRYWEQRIDAQRRIPRHIREGVA